MAAPEEKKVEGKGAPAPRPQFGHALRGWLRKHTGPIVGTFVVAVAVSLVGGGFAIWLTNGFGYWAPTVQEIADQKKAEYDALLSVEEPAKQDAERIRKAAVETSSKAYARALASTNSWAAGKRAELDAAVARDSKTVEGAEAALREARTKLKQAQGAFNAGKTPPRTLLAQIQRVDENIATSSSAFDLAVTQIEELTDKLIPEATKKKEAADEAEKGPDRAHKVMRDSLRAAELEVAEAHTALIKARHAYEDSTEENDSYVAGKHETFLEAQRDLTLAKAKLDAARKAHAPTVATAADASAEMARAAEALEKLEARKTGLEKHRDEVKGTRDAQKKRKAKLRTKLGTFYAKRTQLATQLQEAQAAVTKAEAERASAASTQEEKLAAHERERQKILPEIKKRLAEAKQAQTQANERATREYADAVSKIRERIAKAKADAEQARTRAQGSALAAASK